MRTSTYTLLQNVCKSMNVVPFFDNKPVCLGGLWSLKHIHSTCAFKKRGASFLLVILRCNKGSKSINNIRSTLGSKKDKIQLNEDIAKRAFLWFKKSASFHHFNNKFLWVRVGKNNYTPLKKETKILQFHVPIYAGWSEANWYFWNSSYPFMGQLR